MENKPVGIDDRLSQLRPPIIKLDGATESERYLAKIAGKSFLNLWSYPSPFRNQKQNGRGDGKELCDLLVVCGKHIIIFSEKTIEWPPADLPLAWSRWFRSAVQDSARQAKGAERWIRNFTDQIFLDRECTNPFPISFPSPQEQVFHRVVIARGATQACKEFYKSDSGSLLIKPEIMGEQHWSDKITPVQPFVVGDIDPDGSFVHVFDEVGLDVVLSEMDTISDFTNYLEKRGNFIRSGRLVEALGEENLVAYYSIRINADGDHDFTSDGQPERFSIDRQHYARLISDTRYLAKKEADKISYNWDMLIEAFTTHMLNGTSITLDPKDEEFDLKKSELGVRYMALESRFMRRAHGEAVIGALEKGMATDRFFRSMIPTATSKENETGFFIQTLKYQNWMDESVGYEKYRRHREASATLYAQGLLEKNSHLGRVVGVSREPPMQGRGISEDLLYVEQADWTAKERAEIRENCKKAGLLQDMKPWHWDGQEFPEVHSVFIRPSFQTSHNGMNRKERRAMKSKMRKRKL